MSADQSVQCNQSVFYFNRTFITKKKSNYWGEQYFRADSMQMAACMDVHVLYCLAISLVEGFGLVM